MACSDQLLLRRLLLAKQLYQHALHHSDLPGALNKMIAVHNFHNAIEIVLRTIILEHEISGAKKLNIGFEQLLKCISNHPPFANEGKYLPYHQQLRDLNNLRNMVQHGAVEPPGSTMQEWRVFTARFLRNAIDLYFELPFDELSALIMVEDDHLRRLLQTATDRLGSREPSISLLCVKLAFDWASGCAVRALFPRRGARGVSSFTVDDRAIKRALEQRLKPVSKEIADLRRFSVLVGTGISPVDLGRLEGLWPTATVSADGTVYWTNYVRSDESDAAWALCFVTESVLQWQAAGLSPAVDDISAPALEGFLGKIAGWTESETGLNAPE
jgi:hypothetical protein